MAGFQLKRGDTAPTLVVVLRDSSGNPVDLTGATVTFVMRLATAATNTVPWLQVPMEIAPNQTANRGQVSYQWVSQDTRSAGNYAAEFVVQWPNGTEQTFPTTGYASVVINDDLESHLSSAQREVTRPATPAGLTMTSDAQAKAIIARKTAATTNPVLTDTDLDQLVQYAKRPDGGYNTNRAAAEGWRWKAARVTNSFKFSAGETQVDKSMILEGCLRMVDLYSRSGIRSVRANTTNNPYDTGYY